VGGLAAVGRVCCVVGWCHRTGHCLDGATRLNRLSLPTPPVHSGSPPRIRPPSPPRPRLRLVVLRCFHLPLIPSTPPQLRGGAALTGACPVAASPVPPTRTRDLARCSLLNYCAPADLLRWRAVPHCPHPLAVRGPPALFCASLPPTLHPLRTPAPTHRSSLPSGGPLRVRVTHLNCSGYAPLLGVFPAVGGPLPPTLRHAAAHRSRLVGCGPAFPLWLRRPLRRRHAEPYLPYPLAACALPV